MPFSNTNSHLTTKPCNFDIKDQGNSECYDRHLFSTPTLGVVGILYSGLEVFTTKETILVVAGWNLSYEYSKCRDISSALDYWGYCPR